MKRLFFPLLLAVVFLLAGCSTSVSLTYDNPSEIDMGRYRTVAVASASAFEGLHEPPSYVRAADRPAAIFSNVRSSYDRGLADEVADAATQSLVDKLQQTRFFSIIPPVTADSLIRRSRAGADISQDIARYGIDAFIIPRVVSMDVNEYVSSQCEYVLDYSRPDRNGRPLRIPVYTYFLTQTVSLVYSYTVVDASTMTVYASKTFSDKREYVSEFSSSFFRAPDPIGYFRSMLDAMTTLISWQLAPQQLTLDITLMDNKPKLKEASDAWDLVKDGAIGQAAAEFKEYWQNYDHLPSGYNYALLTAVCGDIDQAISILEEIRTRYSSDKVNDLYDTFLIVRDREEEARAQYEGTGDARIYSDSGDNIFSLIIGD